MTIEEKFPERFLISSFHPTLFIYAFKRTVLDKLFEEVMQSNVAILGGELWVAEGESMRGVIPLKNGGKKVLNWRIEKRKEEQWYDFVERSIKDTLSIIAEANIEQQVSAGIRNKLHYHFDFAEE